MSGTIARPRRSVIIRALSLGPYYGQTQNYFANGTVRSIAVNATLLGKSSLNTYIHEVVEIMTFGAGYAALRIRSFFGSDVVSIQPANDEAFLDAYLEDGPSLVILGRLST